MKIFTCLLLIFPSMVFAQIAFGNEKILLDNTHYNANVVLNLLVDMDDDGDNDLITASDGDSDVLMYENINGDLLYNPRILISDNVQVPGDINASDIDNDGLKDIIVTSKIGNKIIWFKNLGSNTFSEELELMGNFNRPKKIISLDIDSDGDNDFLVNSSQDDNVFLLKNDGAGNFTSPEVVISISDNGNYLAARDLNNDGQMDVIASNWSGAFYWAENLGNGTLSGEQIIGYGDDMEFYDINNDSFLDAIGVDQYDNEVYYYLNQGGNSFGNRITITFTNEDEPSELEISDMDNDGIGDIVVTLQNDSNEDSIGWFKNMGDETFGGLNIISTNIQNPKALIVSDIDGDSKQDVICGARIVSTASKLSYFKNIDSSNFKEIPINFSFGAVYCVRAADINNDGQKDIISGFSKIVWNENHGNNNFSAPRLLSDPYPFEFGFTYDMEILDIDNDNDLDIIALIQNQIQIYENLGNGDFTLQSSISFSHNSENSREIELGDLDGDGLFDIAIPLNFSGINNKAGWFRNLGNNIFSAFIPLNFTGQYNYKPYDLKIGDIDNDGDNDIVTSSPEYGRINFLTNDGSGNFTLTTTSQFIATNQLLLDDVDNDGDLDIITYGYDEWGIYMKKNTNGIFGTTINIDDFQIADDIFLEDIDNDGLKDVIGSSQIHTQNEDENLIFCYLNNGNTFGSKIIIDSKDAESNFPKYLYVSDINNDNKKDIIVGNYWENRLSYYLNASILSIDDNNSTYDKPNLFYPNPVTNTLNWNIPNSNNLFDLDILNELGASIYSVKDHQGSSISLSFLNSGMYFIRLSSNNQSIVKKIIKN